MSISNKFGVYQVTIKKVDDNKLEGTALVNASGDIIKEEAKIVALFKGTVYRTSKNWFE